MAFVDHIIHFIHIIKAINYPIFANDIFFHIQVRHVKKNENYNATGFFVLIVFIAIYLIRPYVTG